MVFLQHEIARPRMVRRAAMWVMTAMLAVSAMAVPAVAQERSPCGERAKVVDRLAQTYAEDQKSIGITSEGNILEVFASRDGSWTVLLTFPDGMACLVEHGESWHNVPPRPTGRIS